MPKYRADQTIESLADDDSRFISIKGIRVHYKEAGMGEPSILLLHGFGGSLFSWESVLPEIAKYGHAVAYDRPAFGLTERPLLKHKENVNPYGTQGQVDMLVELMEQMHFSQSILIGHSAGATVALAMALAHPEQVIALILVAPAVFLFSPVPAWARRFLVRRPIRLFGQTLIHPSRWFVRRILMNVFHEPDKVTPGVVSGYEKPLHAKDWKYGLWEFSAAPHSKDLWKRASELRIPVLVIAGDDDRVVPARQSRRMAEITPGAGFVLIPDCGHVPQEEKPEEFMKAVREFFKQNVKNQGHENSCP